MVAAHEAFDRRDSVAGQMHHELAMQKAMDAEGFGNCSSEAECEAVCPKEIKLSDIARLNREFLRATLTSTEDR